MNINERVKELIKELKMNNNSFSKALGKAPSNLFSIVEGKTKPSFDLLESICTTFPQVSPDWLIMGEGSMFREHSTSQAVDQRPDQYLLDQLTRIEQGYAREIDIKNAQIKDLSEYVRVLLGKSEGTPFEGRLVAPGAFLALGSANWGVPVTRSV